jgi:hypothetical protein
MLLLQDVGIEIRNLSFELARIESTWGVQSIVLALEAPAGNGCHACLAAMPDSFS